MSQPNGTKLSPDQALDILAEELEEARQALQAARVAFRRIRTAGEIWSDDSGYKAKLVQCRQQALDWLAKYGEEP
jgi:hypothetical protein